MNVDPTDAASVETPLANELYDIAMRNDSGLMHTLVSGQEGPASTTITDQKFSINQVMPSHFIKRQQLVHFEVVRNAVRKKPDPDRCIDQDHQPALRLDDTLRRIKGGSRNLGTSWA